jgi:hypothetical protein
MKQCRGVAQELMVIKLAAWWNPRLRRILKAAPLVVVFFLLNLRSAGSCDSNPTPDPTVDGSSNSLRQAIQVANASGQDCLIRLQGGTYTLTVQNTNGQENNAAQGDLDITNSGHVVRILGQGPQVSVINGNGVDRVFQVLGGANAVFQNLTIKGGVAQDNGTAGALPGTTESDGGGLLIQDHGSVRLFNVWINGNQAVGGTGANGAPNASGFAGKPGAGSGVLLSSGRVQLIDSKLFGNTATGGNGGLGGDRIFTTTGRSRTGVGGAGGLGAGGGLYVISGNARLFRSAVFQNSASGGHGGSGGITASGFRRDQGGIGGAGQGAGLFVRTGALNLTRTIVSGNASTGGGGAGGHGDTGKGGPAQGAGIFSAAATQLKQSTISTNSAKGGRGGGNSNISAVSAPGGAAQGAGILVAPNSRMISLNSTLSQNTATGGTGGNVLASSGSASSGGAAQGAGIFVSNGIVRFANTTLFANTAAGGPGGRALSASTQPKGGDAAGGGLYLSNATVSLAGVTLASNRALAATVEPAPQGSSSGGGVANALGGNLATNVTLIGNNKQDSGNASNGDDVSGSITASNSLISHPAGATITDNGGNIFNTNPGLDPGGLRFNGGPTKTVALVGGSSAIDVVPVAQCTDLASPPNPLVTDQRGMPRPDSGENVCDIGAYESQ